MLYIICYTLDAFHIVFKIFRSRSAINLRYKTTFCFFGFRGNNSSVPVKITVSVVMTKNVDVSLDMTSCSLVTGYGRFRGSCCFRHRRTQHRPYSVHSLTIYPDEGGQSSSETSVNCYQTKQYDIQEDGNVNS